MGDHHPEQPARLYAINDRLIASGLDMVLMHYDAPLPRGSSCCASMTPAYVQQVLRQLARTRAMSGWMATRPLGPHTLDGGAPCGGRGGPGGGSGDDRQGGVRPSAPCGRRAIMPSGPGPWVSAFSTMSPWVRRMPWRSTVSSGSPSSISTFTTATAPRTSSAATSGCLFCSTFQHPFYPHTGFDSTGAEHRQLSAAVARRRCGLPRGGAGLIGCRRWKPFAPQLVMISAGFDAHREDDMANLDLHRIRLRVDHAAVVRGRRSPRAAGGWSRRWRVATTWQALARSVAVHIKAFLGDHA